MTASRSRWAIEDSLIRREERKFGSSMIVSRDSFLAPLAIDEREDQAGACPHRQGHRCSDKGFLAVVRNIFDQYEQPEHRLTHGETRRYSRLLDREERHEWNDEYDGKRVGKQSGHTSDVAVLVS